MKKPHPQSVTSTQCQCDYLKHGANDPHNPIYFDETVNEYYFRSKFRGRESASVIYHCPLCGGVASGSHRASLFHDLNEDACREVIEKTKSCVTIGDVIDILGEPDDDQFAEIEHQESIEKSPRVDRVRRITFEHLYDDMCVSFVQQIDGTLSQAFFPKPLEKGK